MSKQPSVLPMINGHIQRQTNGIVIKSKQYRQQPIPMRNGVSNNLYLGAASLTLGQTTHTSKKKYPFNHDSSHKDNSAGARKQSTSSMAYEAQFHRRYGNINDKTVNDGDSPEYTAGNRGTNNDMNSRTQVMFQKNRNQPSNKARPKRQNTLPEETQRA